jgi:hypothetical protein
MSFTFSALNVVSSLNPISEINDEFWNLMKCIETKLLEDNVFDTEDPSCRILEVQLNSIS